MSECPRCGKIDVEIHTCNPKEGVREMELLARLHRKAAADNARFMIRFDPMEPKESAWSLKYYPDPQDNGNFWAEAENLAAAIRTLLDELEGFK